MGNLPVKSRYLRVKLKQDIRWSWTDIDTQVVKKIKKHIGTLPKLYNPGPNDTLIIESDASESYWGGVLKAKVDGGEIISRYASGSFKAAEKNYHSNEKEILALIKTIKAFKAYLLPVKFIARTDNTNTSYFDMDKQAYSERIAYLDDKIELLKLEVSFKTKKICMLESEKTALITEHGKNVPSCTNPSNRKHSSIEKNKNTETYSEDHSGSKTQSHASGSGLYVPIFSVDEYTSEDDKILSPKKKALQPEQEEFKSSDNISLRPNTTAKKFYVIFDGPNSGIYTNWSDD
ncbi:hypothetical protein L6452_38217 [Arctium lappa]|uniref:Uncharacterized protein n=1 Tax=Arctium lappa TaxID=4217 RepID=A0ACB8Y6L1_ARCLA|nr:hypothetical protein L6452_38217 [Arctium lappa]